MDPRYAQADDFAWVGEIRLGPPGTFEASPPGAPVAPGEHRGPVTSTLARPDEPNSAPLPVPRSPGPGGAS